MKRRQDNEKEISSIICLSMAASFLTACGGDTTSTPAATQEAAKLRHLQPAVKRHPETLRKLRSHCGRTDYSYKRGTDADVNVVQTLLKR